MINIFDRKKVVAIFCIIAFVLAGVAMLAGCSGGRDDDGGEVVTPPGGDTTDDNAGARPEGKTVADYTDDPNYNLYVAKSVLAEAGSFRSVSRGSTVSTKIGFSVTQDIYAVRIVKGDSVYKQSSSYGLIKMGDERVVHGETYLYRSATGLKSVTDMSWSDDAPNSLTREEFLNRYGYRGNGLTGYILNDETIVSSSFDGVDESTGLYSFTYVLDNEKATVCMLYEMRTNSGSSNFATYDKAVIHVTMDKNWIVRTISTDCVYRVPLLGSTLCRETLTEEFCDIGEVSDYTHFPHYDYFSEYADFNTAPPEIGDNAEKRAAAKKRGAFFAVYPTLSLITVEEREVHPGNILLSRRIDG